MKMTKMTALLLAAAMALTACGSTAAVSSEAAASAAAAPEVTTSPENFTAVCDALEKKGYKFISADVAQVPSTTTALTDPDQLVQMGKLLDALDDDDDVQNAWHTLENEEDLDR